jgi:hypothetical protein
MTLQKHMSARLKLELEKVIKTWAASRTTLPTYVHTTLRDALDAWMTSTLPPGTKTPRLAFSTMTIPEALLAAETAVLAILLETNDTVEWSPQLEAAVSYSSLDKWSSTPLTVSSFIKLLANPAWRTTLAIPEVHKGAPCRKRELHRTTEVFPSISTLGELSWSSLGDADVEVIKVPSLDYLLRLENSELSILYDGKVIQQLGVPESHTYVACDIAPCGAVHIVTGKRNDITGGMESTSFALRHIGPGKGFAPEELSDEEEVEALRASEERTASHKIDFRDHGSVLALLTGPFGSKVVCNDAILFETPEILQHALGCAQDYFLFYYSGKVVRITGSNKEERALAFKNPYLL